MNYLDFYQKKQSQQKISCVTCYDYSSARILSETPVDCLLVGDSVAMTMHGHQNTLAATIEMLALHTSAVHRGAGNKFIISDMPFLTYRKSLNENMNNVHRLVQAGAHALKLENAQGNIKFIQHVVESGIPVMGHLGLTPQSINLLGGYRIQGKSEKSANLLKKDAERLQDAGCFALVLECIPAGLAKEITAHLSIPTIGIGAGPHTDGQVLVYQDLLGLNLDLKPKFVKQFMNGSELVKESINAYIKEIQSQAFPADENSF